MRLEQPMWAIVRRTGDVIECLDIGHAEMWVRNRLKEKQALFRRAYPKNARVVRCKLVPVADGERESK